MNKNRIWQIAVALVGVLVVLGSAASARADETSTNYTLYVSSPGTGTVGGVAYNDEDVMRFSPNTGQKWAKHFDGTDAGLTAAADIDAYDYRWNSNTFTSFHYLSFDRPVAVPGMGTVDDSDIVLYTQSLLGNSWTLYFDGSQIGLTTDAEDIDSFYVNVVGDILFSTAGNFSVPNPGGTEYAGQDEDLIMWSMSQGQITSALDGVNLFLVPGSADVYNLSFAPGGGMYYAVQKPAIVASMPTGGFDILLKVGVSTYSLFWDASDNGFPKIDAMAVVTQ